MMWQDLVLGIGGFAFAPALIALLRQSIRERARVVPLATSLPTAAILFAFAVADISLDLYLATVSVVITGVMWLLLAVDWSKVLPPVPLAVPALFMCPDCQNAEHEHHIYPEGIYCQGCNDYCDWL